VGGGRRQSRLRPSHARASRGRAARRCDARRTARAAEKRREGNENAVTEWQITSPHRSQAERHMLNGAREGLSPSANSGGPQRAATEPPALRGMTPRASRRPRLQPATELTTKFVPSCHAANPRRAPGEPRSVAAARSWVQEIGSAGCREERGARHPAMSANIYVCLAPLFVVLPDGRYPTPCREIEMA